ncbi:MAG: toll/interleukin-1 receptor domain-containing protein [Gammaproteobacteria bacterium]|nr:toll/interleukin-1 receptor domain-containing protein [Gammaproteobacteria bacterium]
MKVFLSYAHDDADLAGRVCKALANSGLDVTDPDRDHLPGENWAGEVARALEESEAMVVLLTPAAVSSPDVKRNIEYALGAKNYSNRLIPVVVGDREHFPAAEVPWIVRRMPWFELHDTEPPKIEPIAEAILSHA